MPVEVAGDRKRPEGLRVHVKRGYSLQHERSKKEPCLTHMQKIRGTKHRFLFYGRSEQNLCF